MVRYVEPGTASASLRLDRRQRQSLWRAHRTLGGPPRAGAREVGAESDHVRGWDELRFLYNPKRRLLSIGHHGADAEGPGRLDPSNYDLLASEARLASFIAIAKGDVPEVHWFRLGRTATSIHVVPTLLSWSATLFEYLMPQLLMRSYPGTLLDDSCKMAVRRQRDYGLQRGAPWGISESAYDAVDRNDNYQYKAFGVPGLGLKRGLASELVVAPYATALATLVDPQAAAKNLRHLASEGLYGTYGAFDAIDYTVRRSEDPEAITAPPGRPRGKVIRAYFAHHQGMTLTAIANVLRGRRMVERFHADLSVQATELLLQEQAPRHASVLGPRPDDETRIAAPVAAVAVRRFRSPHTTFPHAQFLSNGNYTAVVTNAGGGASTCRGRAVTRYRQDFTCDPGSQFIYLRDVRSGAVWSATHQPTGKEAEDDLVTFTAEKAVFQRRFHGVATRLEVAVSPEDDVEVRRLAITNRGDRTCEIEVTSYAEIVLAPPADDLAHPAFGKLFVETEYVPENSALLCRRRSRAPDDAAVWAFHVISQEGRTQGPVEWETDRGRFLGRGHGLENPQALDGRPLTGTTGVLLDPIVSLRQRLRLAPGAVVRVSFATGMAPSRETALALAQRYRDPSATPRTFAMAFAHARSALRYLGVTSEEAILFERLASRTLYADASLRASPDVLARNELGQEGLWGHGISGDLPVLLVRVLEGDGLGLVRQTLQAQEYWRLKGLSADVVILNEHPVSYLDEVHGQLAALLDDGPWRTWKHRPGGAYLLRGDRMSGPERDLLAAVARAVLVDARGTLAQQLDLPAPLAPVMAETAFPHQPRPVHAQPLDSSVPALTIANGIGGFASGGREYVIVLEGDRETPQPWSNVIASPCLGTIVTASGSAFTWSENSRENRLTPFANDPVSDPTAEAIFVRDDETGATWAPTPGPLPRTSTSGRFVIRHGAGVSSFTRTASGLRHTVDVFVDATDPVKFSLLTMTNDGGASRHLSIFAYNEWVLGPPQANDRRHVITERDAETGAILATNAFNHEFAGRVAFAFSTRATTFGHGRPHLLPGAQRLPVHPAALGHEVLSEQFGAGSDPCAAVHLDHSGSGRDAAAGLPPRGGKGRREGAGACAPPRSGRCRRGGPGDCTARVG